MARLSSELVLELTDRVSGPARSIDRNLDALQRRNGALSRSARMTYDDVGLLTRAAPMMAASVAGVLAPVGAAIGGQQIVSAAADFESALTEIQKKAGISTEQTAKLGEEIKALATSGDLAVPISEIAAAYERGAAAGIPIDDLKEFAEQSVKAADAFSMTAEDVGNFAAKLKTGLGLSNDEVRRVFDLTNSLADAGIADESGLVDYMDRVGASLKTLGLSPAQSLALGSTMLNLGMTSEVAATGTDALANRLLTVSTITGGKRKTFERYMGSVSAFADMVDKDANAALMTMLERLRTLDSRDRMAFLTEFMGQEHAGKILRISEAIDELRSNQALAADESRWFGSLDASYKLKLDDFWSQWQVVKNAMEKLAIDSGNAGMPFLKAGLETALSLVQEVDAGLKTFRAEVDMSALAEARLALGDLGDEIAMLMNATPGEGGHIKRFFSDLAGLVDEVSAGVKGLSNAFEDVAAFANDPRGYMKSRAEMSDRQMQDRYGITRLDENEVSDRVERQDRRRNAVHARERGERRRTLQTTGGAGAAYTRNQMFLRGELTPDDYRRQDPERAFATAERLGFNRHRQGETNGLAASYFRRQTGESERQLSEAMIGMPESAKAGMQAYAAAIAASGGQVTDEARTIAAQVRAKLARIAPSAPPVPTGTVERGALGPVPASGGPPIPTPRSNIGAPVREEAERGALGPVPASGGPPIPTPRPNIEAPVREEAERAALAAEAAGLRIGDALSVSARPNVDTSAIDTATAKAERLARILERIPGLATRASAAANAAQADYSGIHATIER